MSDLTDKMPVDAEPSGSLSADPQDHQASNKRPKRHWFIVGICGIALLVVMVVGSQVLRGGPDSTPEPSADAQRVAIESLQGQIQSIEQRLSSIEEQGTRVAALGQRLDIIDERISQQAGDFDPEALASRMEALETFLEDAAPQIDMQMTALEEVVSTRLADVAASRPAEDVKPSPAPARTHARADRRPATPRVPLRISGIEYRGGHPFLSVATGSVNSLDQVILLGERESVGEWQLVQINATTAVFRYRGQDVTVNLP